MKVSNKRFVDLSHEIGDGLVTVPGLSATRIETHLSREASAARYAGGLDIPDLPLEKLADLDGVVVRASETHERALEAGSFAGLDVAGKAVLVDTGWSARWQSPAYAEASPYLTKAAAEYLCDAGAALVGIDAPNVDDTRDRARPAHSALLAAAIPIVEHLTNLDSLPRSGFRFTAVPAPVRGVGTFPVRAFATFES